MPVFMRREEKKIDRFIKKKRMEMTHRVILKKRLSLEESAQLLGSAISKKVSSHSQYNKIASKAMYS